MDKKRYVNQLKYGKIIILLPISYISTHFCYQKSKDVKNCFLKLPPSNNMITFLSPVVSSFLHPLLQLVFDVTLLFFSVLFLELQSHTVHSHDNGHVFDVVHINDIRLFETG